jgi:hypothetical protein
MEDGVLTLPECLGNYLIPAEVISGSQLSGSGNVLGIRY